MKKFLLVLIFIFIIPSKIFANELGDQLKGYDFDKVTAIINSNIDENVEQVDFNNLVAEIISGRFNFLSLPSVAKDIFFRDIKENIVDVRNLFMLIVLAGVIKNLTDSFNTKSTAEIAFYISYIVIVTKLFVSFKISVGIAQNLLQNISQIVQASLPLIISLMVSSGNISASAVFNPIIFLISDVIILIINFILPAVVMFVTVQIINNITGKNLIANFAELIKNLIGWCLKIISIAFMAVLSLQRITAPLLETVAAKSAKFAVNSIPLVGEVFTGAVDSVISWAHLIKNGTLVALIVSVFFLCMVPIIKLSVCILIYKIFAAIIQPISDERIVKCVEAIASACVLLLSCSFTVVIIFLFAVIIFVSM